MARIKGFLGLNWVSGEILVHPLIQAIPVQTTGDETMINDPLTYKIIGCAMTVHRTLGNGFQEVIYQRALAIEMRKKGLRFVREQEMPVYYDSIEIGKRRVDFFVEQKVLVELKALTELQDVHLAQGLNYLEAFNMEIGLLINFGAASLDYKRLTKKRNLNRDGRD